MSGQQSSIFFIDSSPDQTLREKELLRAEASSHAAKVTHEKRRKTEQRVSANHGRKTALVRRTKGPGASKAISHQSELSKLTRTPSDSAENLDLDLYQIRCYCGHSTSSSHGPQSSTLYNPCFFCEYGDGLSAHGGSSSDSEQDSPKALTGVHNYPSQRVGWTSTELSDFQFFVEILGGSVRTLSDSGFYNIVLPCFAETVLGIRQIILSFASAYRNHTSPMITGRNADRSNMRALERFGEAIRSLSAESDSMPVEAQQASSVMMAQWNLLRMDYQAATTSIQTAARLCRMSRPSVIKHRLISARNSTDPMRDLNYLRSTFATIVSGTVAKLLLSFPDMAGSPLDLSRKAHRLNISTDMFTWPINDIHDILGAIEFFQPTYHQLRANIAYRACIDQDSQLAQTLLMRLQQILLFLQAADCSGRQMLNAVIVLTQYSRYYRIGLECFVFSTSAMSFDSFTEEFAAMVDWAEAFFADNVVPYVYIPNSIMIQPLLLMVISCRQPSLRRRAIAILLQNHRNENGIDSWIAGCVATEIMYLEERGRDPLDILRSGQPHSAADIPEHDRIILRGFEYVDQQLYLLYMYATETAYPDATALRRYPFSIPRDPHGVVDSLSDLSVEHLHGLVVLVQQATFDQAPQGCVLPVYCDGEQVDINV